MFAFPKPRRLALLLLMPALLPARAGHVMAQSPAATHRSSADGPEASLIRQLLTQQTADWNRGDLDAFARGYKNSPDILFMGGRSIQRGYAGMLARYREHYPTRASMGTLTFTELDVQPLGPTFATTTGRFHLERSAAGGGNADGVFMLVLEKTPDQGWKIVRDATTSLPAQGSR